MTVKQSPDASFAPQAGCQQVKSMVPRVTVYAPEPETTEINPAYRYACPNCGANTAYDVSAGGIFCCQSV
ncbi:MAG: hypothetical protein GX142_00990 [Chloroflexi bacterium]|nr:hypothetical protein [Chloroflexota bacterium]